MTDPREANRQLWNEWTDEHVASEFYDVPGFLAGGDMLDPMILENLGDVTGKRLLHLQCHFGMDTMALARYGAVATGVDFSPKAIATARELAVKTGQETTFVESPIENLPDRLDGKFDIVFTSAGVLCWLGDLSRWAEVIRHFLAPGGTFLIIEGHPFSWIFDNTRDDDRLVPEKGWSYFTREPVAWPNEGSYTGATPDAKYEVHFEWMHSVSEIVMALLGAGLSIEKFVEHPFCGYQAFPFLVEHEDENWYTPEGYADLPLSLTIVCRG